MQQLLTSIAKAAETLDSGRTTIYKLINSGKIETVKLGRRRLVKVASLQALIGEGQPE